MLCGVQDRNMSSNFKSKQCLNRENNVQEKDNACKDEVLKQDNSITR